MTTRTSPALVAKICDRAAQTTDVRGRALAGYVEYVAKEAAARGAVVDRADLTAAVDARWQRAGRHLFRLRPIQRALTLDQSNTAPRWPEHNRAGRRITRYPGVRLSSWTTVEGTRCETFSPA